MFMMMGWTAGVCKNIKVSYAWRPLYTRNSCRLAPEVKPFREGWN